MCVCVLLGVVTLVAGCAGCQGDELCGTCDNSRLRSRSCSRLVWVLVKGFSLSYHNKETILFTIDPHYGSLN